MFYQHAMNCGINMTGKCAVALKDSAGMLLMVDVIDPETTLPVVHAGTTMDIQLIELLQGYGVDYVVVYYKRFTEPRGPNLGQNQNVAAY